MFIRYNETLKFWEYDTSPEQTGAGPWVLLPVDASKLIVGPALGNIAYTNIAYTNVKNKFTYPQIIEAGDVDVPYIGFRYTAMGPDLKNSRFEGVGDFYISHTNDADDTYLKRWKFGRDGVLDAPGSIGVQGFLATTATIYSGGVFVERGRSTPLGEWIDIPFNAANFVSTVGTWTLTAANVQTNKYTLIGKTAIWVLVLGPGTFSDSTQHIIIQIPTGIVPSGQIQGTGQINVGGTWGLALLSWVGGTNLNIYKHDIAFMPAGNMYLSFQFVIPFN